MSYATEADLDREFSAEIITILADRDMDGVRDQGVVARALEWSDNFINSKIVTVVQLPLVAPYPPRLVDIALDLAYYRLHRLPTDEVLARYKSASLQLDAVRDGKESLGLAGGGATIQEQEADVAFSVPESVFSDRSMAGY